MADIIAIPHLFTEMGPLNTLYAPLIIAQVQSNPLVVATNIFLTSYSEKYKGRWNAEATYGILNRHWTYAGTGKTIDIQFTLPAKNVQEAIRNLQYTTFLANTVHGNYEKIDDAFNETAESRRFRLQGGKLFKIRFGNLIRDELVYISNFNMNVNFEAGFYEQDAVGAELKALAESGQLPDPLEYVYHDKVGEILPKQVDITLSFIMVHDKPLGFGGAKRVASSLGWAPNDGRDWPHGTGPIPAAEYCQSELNQEADMRDFAVGRGGIPPGTRILEEDDPIISSGEISQSEVDADYHNVLGQEDVAVEEQNRISEYERERDILEAENEQWVREQDESNFQW